MTTAYTIISHLLCVALDIITKSTAQLYPESNKKDLKFCEFLLVKFLSAVKRTQRVVRQNTLMESYAIRDVMLRARPEHPCQKPILGVGA